MSQMIAYFRFLPPNTLLPNLQFALQKAQIFDLILHFLRLLLAETLIQTVLRETAKQKVIKRKRPEKGETIEEVKEKTFP